MILVEIHVPAMNRAYDFQLDENADIGSVIDELAELIDIMIYTKVIEIKTIESDMKYWAHWTAKELVSISNYLTENEIYVLQDLMMRCKERAGR